MINAANIYNMASPVKAPDVSNKNQQAKDVAEDFEAFFITKMMESMFEGVSTDGLFGGGHAEKIYRSMLLNEYGKVMAKTGSVGVADSVMSAIIEMQEAQNMTGVEKNENSN